MTNIEVLNNIRVNTDQVSKDADIQTLRREMNLLNFLLTGLKPITRVNSSGVYVTNYVLPTEKMTSEKETNMLRYLQERLVTTNITGDRR